MELTREGVRHNACRGDVAGILVTGSVIQEAPGGAEGGAESALPAASEEAGLDLNQRHPPCQGGALTN